MSFIRAIGVASVAGWLGGCAAISDWMSTDTNALPTPLEPLSEQVLKPLWRVSGGSGTQKQFLRLRPIALESRVVVANSDGGVVAYDSFNGNLLWKAETGISLSGGTGGGEGLVIVGGSKGEVVALQLKDGSERWRTGVSSEVLAPPAASEGIVVVRAVDGRVTALSAPNGTRLWTFSRTVPVLSLRGTSAPRIAAEKVFIGLDSGRLTAIGLRDGHELWDAAVAVPRGRSELERMVDIDADPILFRDTVYVSAFQGRIMAIDAETGQPRWARDISSSAGLGVDRDRVYVTDETSVLWALDRSTGSVLWKQEGLKNRALTAPVSYGDNIVVGDLEGYLHTIRRRDGEIIGRLSLDGYPILAAPITQGAVLYATSSAGTLAALRD